MSRCTFSRLALADLHSIRRYIQQDSVAAARRMVDRIEATCEQLAANPRLGERRVDFGEAIRIFSVGNYVVFYRPADRGIEVIRVLHGARDYESLFED